MTHSCRYLLSALVCAALSNVRPALTHHSYATFDSKRIVTLEGTVETFRWTNPHVVLKLLVRGQGGALQEWNIETSGPAILTRFGWRRDSMKPGDHVSVICNPLSNGSYGGHLHTLRMLDTGRTLRTKLSASSEPGS